jgi:hypothetical protein
MLRHHREARGGPDGGPIEVRLVRIDDLRTETDEGGAWVAARVTWEDSDRSPMDIFFATDERFASNLSCDPHAFLVACVPPALRHGESRIAIDEDICPELHDGLQTATAILQRAAGRNAELRIEARSTDRLPSGPPRVRAGAFLSGGVDSLANLRLNRLTYPADHPRAFRDCLLVQGFDIGLRDESGAFERAVTSLSAVAQDAGVTVIPVKTNVRLLDRESAFWMRESHGAALASVAHTLTDRLHSVSIASTLDVSGLAQPWGSHPLLDPCYGSAALRIYHDGIRYTRLDKLRLVAGWDAALQNLRVCTRKGSPGLLNCGRCEKCTRTMLGLLAIGHLGRCRAFEEDDVPKSALRRISITSGYHLLSYRELIQPLAEIGRRDLARGIEERTLRYSAWEEGRGWRGLLTRPGRRGAGVIRSVRALDETRDVRRAARRVFERSWS